MGLIAVEGMHFYAHHGYYKEEQVIGGQYMVDVYVNAGFSKAATEDDLTGTINYEEIYIIVKEVMQEKSKLIEHVANLILDKLEAKFQSRVATIKVRVAKINPPLKGTVNRVFVEVQRDY